MENFIKIDSVMNEKYFVLYRIENNKIIFRIDNVEKTYIIKEKSKYYFRPLKNIILCYSIERLKKGLENPSMNYHNIQVVKEALGFKSNL